MGTYKRPPSSPKPPDLLSSKFPSIVDLPRACPSPFLHDSCSYLKGKERGDLDPLFHQSISPLSEGSLLDLDLWIHLLSSSLFFLSCSSIPFVGLVGLESEGLDHLVWSCHCIGCIGLGSLRGFVRVKS